MNHTGTRIALPFVVALVTMFGTTTMTQSQTCPNSSGNKYAYATVTFEDRNIVKATDIIEIADPFMNPCPGLHSDGRWAAQVLWLVDESTEMFAEIGWRRRCPSFLFSDTDFFYYSIGSFGAGPRVMKDTSGNVINPQPGERWKVTIEKQDDAHDVDNDKWRFQLIGPGGGDRV